MKRSIGAFLAVLTLAGLNPAIRADEISNLPWTLRDHYTFDAPRISLIYAVDNGEWCLNRADGKVLLDKARASVTLGDGKVIDVNAMGPGDAFRRRDVTELGDGSRYGLKLTGSQGVAVEHSITSHKQHPYYLIRVTVTNTSAEPIEVAAISPVVVPRGSMAQLDPEVEVQRRTMDVLGPNAGFNPASPAHILTFHNKSVGYMTTLGVFPRDVARTGINLQFFDGQWQGEITSTFDPPVRLAPGQSLEADPIWLAFTFDTPEALDQFISYTHATLKKPAFDTDIVEAWSTAGEGEPLSAVEAAAKEWSAVGVKHVLIPYGWEGRPGSLQGADPAYPGNMGAAARQLQAAGVTPGITVDILDIGKGADPWAITSNDGHVWANPADPAGRDAVLKAAKTVAGWGFGFYAVRPTAMPDEVLKTFQLTRTQADALAYAIMAEAAGDAPVYRTALGHLGTNVDQWLQAAICSSRLDEYDAIAGPVRFDGGGQNVSPEVLFGMVLFGGPIEFAGSPSRDLENGLKQVLPKPRVWSRAIDACAETPKIWELHMRLNDQQPTEKAILVFGGAQAPAGDVWQPTEENLKRLAGKFAFLRAIPNRPAPKPAK
ncbi:MAG: hypothetical protein AMXMBFR84_29210 [Candidatus Hydrogenedentota bacterium]